MQCTPLLYGMARESEFGAGAVRWIVYTMAEARQRRLPNAFQPMPARPADLLLLRSELPWCRWRAGEIGGKLRVARLCVLHRLLLHRAVAADTVGQRQEFGRRIDRGRRYQSEHVPDLLLVACHQ